MSQSLDETKWKETIKEAYSHAVSEKEKILQEIENRIRDIDPVELLSHLSLVTNFIPENKPECNQELRDEPIIHFLCGLYLKLDSLTNRHPNNQEVSKIIDLIKKYLIYFRQEMAFQFTKKDQVAKEDELIHSAISHRMIKQINPCIYMFQLDDLVKSIFGKLDSYFLNSVGFTVSDALMFGQKIYGRYQKKVNKRIDEAREATAKAKQQLEDDVEGKKMREMLKQQNATKEEFLESYFNFLSFTLTQRIFVFDFDSFCEEEHIEDKSRFENYLNHMSCELGKGNKNYATPLDENLINIKPIIRLREKEYFCPLPQNLLNNLPQIFEEALNEEKKKQSSVWQRYQRIKSDYTESQTYDFFSRIFPKGSIFRNLKYGTDDEVDILIVYDNKIFLIEAKSVNFLARPDRLKWDLKKSVGASYEQSKKARAFIINNKRSVFTNHGGTKVLEIEYEKNRFKFFLVSVTLENLLTFATTLKRLRAIGLFTENEYPWSVNLQELDLITRHTPSPTIFIHYLKRRLEALSEDVFFASDELSFFAWYLDHGNFYIPVEDDGKPCDLIGLCADFVGRFDNHYLFNGPAPKLNIEPGLQEIIGILETLRPRGYSDIACFLLDLPHEARKELLKNIDLVIGKTKSDGKYHNFTILYKDKLDCGVTFMSQCGRQSLEKKLVSYCVMKKYQQKVRRWLGMGRDILDNDWYINEFLYIDSEWKYDEEMEKGLKNCSFQR